jgi:DDE superfamily endonuclease
MTKRKIEYWVIPPDADGEFVAHMEEVLETYEKAHDPDCPVVCMDEQPVQLIGETRVPIPATKEHPERVDYEYERKGTASIFMFAEPLSGFRQATARPHRTKDDWADEVAQLLDTRYANTPRITLVCDNLNTHTCEPTDHRLVRQVVLPPLSRRAEWPRERPATAWSGVGYSFRSL